MIFDDCMNYRENLRECVELCIMGTLTKDQALKLLHSRYKFMLPKETLTLSLGKVPDDKAKLFFALLKDEKKCNAYEYHLNHRDGTMQEFAEHAFRLKGALGLHPSGDDLDDESKDDIAFAEALTGQNLLANLDDKLFDEALKIGYKIIKYTKDITELYDFCKKEGSRLVP